MNNQPWFYWGIRGRAVLILMLWPVFISGWSINLQLIFYLHRIIGPVWFGAFIVTVQPFLEFVASLVNGWYFVKVGPYDRFVFFVEVEHGPSDCFKSFIHLQKSFLHLEIAQEDHINYLSLTFNLVNYIFQFFIHCFLRDLASRPIFHRLCICFSPFGISFLWGWTGSSTFGIGFRGGDTEEHIGEIVSKFESLRMAGRLAGSFTAVNFCRVAGVLVGLVFAGRWSLLAPTLGLLRLSNFCAFSSLSISSHFILTKAHPTHTTPLTWL